MMNILHSTSIKELAAAFVQVTYEKLKKGHVVNDVGDQGFSEMPLHMK